MDKSSIKYPGDSKMEPFLILQGQITRLAVSGPRTPSNPCTSPLVSTDEDIPKSSWTIRLENQGSVEGEEV